ncbi:hypothetical protein D3C72_1551740 [compost metagenome]
MVQEAPQQADQDQFHQGVGDNSTVAVKGVGGTERTAEKVNQEWQGEKQCHTADPVQDRDNTRHGQSDLAQI